MTSYGSLKIGSIDTSILCDVAHIPIRMRIRIGKNLLLKGKAVLIIAVLLCLCASDSVGPRLLPLPNVSVVTAFSVSPSSLFLASQAPGPTKEQNAYSEMLAGSQYRTRDRHSDDQVGTHAPQGALSSHPSNLARALVLYDSLSTKTPSPSVPSGRAPPRAT